MSLIYWGKYPCLLTLSIIYLNMIIIFLYRVDYIISPLKILQSLKESVTPPDEKYSLMRRLSPNSAASYNFTDKEVCFLNWSCWKIFSSIPLHPCLSLVTHLAIWLMMLESTDICSLWSGTSIALRRLWGLQLWNSWTLERMGTQANQSCLKNYLGKYGHPLMCKRYNQLINSNKKMVHVFLVE